MKNALLSSITFSFFLVYYVFVKFWVSWNLFAHCSFASNYWVTVLDAFGWYLALLNNIYDLFASILMGHPFHGVKKLLRAALNWCLFWSLRRERNGCIFIDISYSFEYFMDLILLNSLRWCKCKYLFTNCCLSTLIAISRTFF